RDLALRLVLSDDVLIEEGLDLRGSGHAAVPPGDRLLLRVLANDVQAEPDALGADVDVRPRDDLFDLALWFVAERTAQPAGIAVLAHRLLSAGPVRVPSQVSGL